MSTKGGQGSTATSELANIANSVSGPVACLFEVSFGLTTVLIFQPNRYNYKMLSSVELKSLPGGVNNTMSLALPAAPKSSPGFRIRKLRMSQQLSRRQLSNITGVSPEEVNLLEHNLPVRLEVKLNVFRELWKRKAGGYGIKK